MNINSIKDKMNELLDKAYKAGYNDGIDFSEEAHACATDYRPDDACCSGCSKRPVEKHDCDTCQYNGWTLENLKKCANCYGNSGWTPKQTKDDEIKIGDEVILDRKYSYVSNVRGVVIACNSCSDHPYKIMLSEGYSKWMKADSIDRKTGRTFPQMTEILKQMKEG